MTQITRIGHSVIRVIRVQYFRPSVPYKSRRDSTPSERYRVFFYLKAILHYCTTGLSSGSSSPPPV